MKKIQFLTASDRLNYGDLLFPIISKQLILSKINCEFACYALIESDLSFFGALPTRSYRILEIENNDDCMVIIGGGHVMFPNWKILYGHINRFYLNSLNYSLFRALYIFFDVPRRFFTSSKIESPFAPYHLKGELTYLSAGGNFNNYKQNKKVYQMLNQVALLSVRDNMLYEQLKSSGLRVFKIPDTAIVISILFDRDSLVKKLSPLFNFNIHEKYVVIQLGLHKGPSHKNKFVQNINILKANGYKILCMPIGLAANHDDIKVLKPLTEIDRDWNYYYPKNIFEIMHLIANAECFLGTSLHGCITAFSYNVPFVPLNKKVKKLNNYTKTWWYSFLKESVDYNNLDNFIKNELLSWNKQVAKEKLREQQSIVMENYDRLIKLLSN